MTGAGDVAALSVVPPTPASGSASRVGVQGASIALFFASSFVSSAIASFTFTFDDFFFGESKLFEDFFFFSLVFSSVTFPSSSTASDFGVLTFFFLGCRSVCMIFLSWQLRCDAYSEKAESESLVVPLAYLFRWRLCTARPSLSGLTVRPPVDLDWRFLPDRLRFLQLRLLAFRCCYRLATGRHRCIHGL